MEHEQNIIVTVEDQGPSIKKDQLTNIFELFHSGIYSDNRQMKGVGIGLALAKEPIELHGGHIEAFNNQYGGFTVKFTIKNKGALGLSALAGENKSMLPAFNPITNARADTPECKNTGKYHQLPQVLLVEDNEELRGFFVEKNLVMFHFQMGNCITILTALLNRALLIWDGFQNLKEQVLFK